MKILAFAEQRNGQFKKTAFETVAAAASLGGEVTALVIGGTAAAIAPQLGGYGAANVIAAEDPAVELYSATAYAKIIAETAEAAGADVVLLPASAMGKDVAPRVAVKLQAGLAADCTALTAAGGVLTASRPVYGGKGVVDVVVTTPRKVFTLRPNVFTAGAPSGAAASVERRAVSLQPSDLSSAVKEVKQSGGKKDVSEADVVVSGGRGLKEPEHFAMLEELAGLLGGAVGASRAVVDSGWRPHDEQVGQTGKTVSPSLYIAVGISGAVQHLAGMSSSKYIVAVNKDKDAPIFSVADYGIAGDAFEVLPAVTAEVKKLLGK